MVEEFKYFYVDAHIHLYENENLAKNKEFTFLSVSEDVESSLKNIKISLFYENVIPAIGIHPWNVYKSSEDDVKTIERLVKENNIKVLGEIGLDKRFGKDFEKQKKYFEYFLNIAKEYDLSINIHSVDAYREIFDLIIKYDIKKVYFHWYNGPIDLLDEIINKGFFIGINVSWKIQEKHRKIMEYTPIKNIITESDSPYIYKGLLFMPDLIKDTYNKLSEIKGIHLKMVGNIIKENLSKFLY